MKANESKPQMKCRKALDDIKSGECTFARDEPGGSLFIGQVVSGMHAARAWVRLLYGTWEPVVSRDGRPVVCDLRLIGHGRIPSGRNREDKSTDARHRGGPSGSSDEGPVMGLERSGRAVQTRLLVNHEVLWEEPMVESKSKVKSFVISKRLFWEAWKQVRANQGAAGVDEESVAQFERNLSGNLYKLWNRMSSGTYMPPPVKAVQIPKKDGRGVRTLGVPTVADRVAQKVVKLYLEPDVEPVFHEDSYGYRPGRSALDAVEVCRKRCWKMNWVIDWITQPFSTRLITSSC